jgi:peptidoglycan/LPS O-acetylase OafA/YrhL
MPPAALAQSHEVPTADPSRNHLPALDGLRGIAILAVVAFHVAVVASANAPWAYRSAAPWYAWPAFAGSLGVDLFFVLSGFLVLRSWRSIRTRYDRDGFGAVVEFARRRGRRIFPPYLFALAILVPWRVPHWLSSAEGLSNIAMFASLNHFLDPSLPAKLSTVTWSLTTETHFYVLLPILASVGVRYGWGRMLACLLVATVWWRLTVGGTGDEAEWILGRADQFVAGMFGCTLVDAYRNGETSPVLRFLTGRRAGWLLGGVLATIALAHGGLRLLPKPLFFLVTLHAIVGIAVAGLIVRWLCFGRTRLLRNRVLGGLGLVSYSLYLWHWPLLAEASSRWGATAPVLAGTVALALVASLVSYLMLERPFARGRSERSGDQRWLGSNTDATIANSPWAASSSSTEIAPLGNRT